MPIATTARRVARGIEPAHVRAVASTKQIDALIVAAGRGARAAGEIPKQYRRIGGKALVAHAIDAMTANAAIGRVWVVAAEGQEALFADARGDRDVMPPILGGASRRESVRAGLDAIVAAGGGDIVLVHDAARPFLPAAVLDRLIEALERDPELAGSIPVLSVADTLARADDAVMGDAIARDGLVRVQTPQAFRLAALVAAHDRWPASAEATDDAQMVRAAGGRVALVAGDALLDKVTHPADFAAAEARLPMVSRCATGFDVHRLEAGEELRLGGVLIPHDRGLSGHSDADVALHAITDALLGTIAAGDIGLHFPPSDPRWRGADSAQFLDHAAGLVMAAGGRIDFIDLTLICEAPRIGPHRDAIRARIADLLRLDPTQISVKATTTERLGFTGRGEGIAAQAIATVRLPDALRQDRR